MYPHYSSHNFHSKIFRRGKKNFFFSLLCRLCASMLLKKFFSPSTDSSCFFFLFLSLLFHSLHQRSRLLYFFATPLPFITQVRRYTEKKKSTGIIHFPRVGSLFRLIFSFSLASFFLPSIFSFGLPRRIYIFFFLIT